MGPAGPLARAVLTTDQFERILAIVRDLDDLDDGGELVSQLMARA
jgi:hypothetical protein